jgi:hypothetical protein
MKARTVAATLVVALGACSNDTPVPSLPTTMVRSSFVFDDDAFSFENFGGVQDNAMMRASLLARMFGKEAVCVADGGDICHLLPIAKEYMHALNQSVRGGRCEGFAVLGGLVANNSVDVTAFGADSARTAEITDDNGLGGEIAYWFSTQFLRDVVPESTIALDAVGTVEHLAQAFADDENTMVRIGLALLHEDTGELTGGHAVLAIDVGPAADDGHYVVGIYDSNHPDARREILVDANANRWEYQASADPTSTSTLYVGDLDNGNVLYLSPVKPREGVHPCTFCDIDADDEAAVEDEMAQVFGSASAEIVAVHGDGQRAGEIDGALFTEHDSGHALPSFTAACHDCRDGMHLAVPHDDDGGTLLELRLATHGPIEEGVLLPIEARYFGHGFAVTVEGADIEVAEEVHTLHINGDGTDTTFTSSPAAPQDEAVIAIAHEIADGEHLFVEAKVVGSELAVIDISPAANTATLTVRGDATTTATVLVRVSTTDRGLVRSVSANIPMPPAGSATIDVATSEADGEMVVLLDNDGDGAIDDTVLLPDLGIDADEL